MRCTLRLVLVASALLFATLTHAADGLVAIKSSHDVKATADKLESVLKEKGMTVMARVNHQQGAEKAGLELRLGYNDPQYLKSRHGIEGCDEVLGKVSGALGNFAKAATR